jgi:mRNA interferase MazF
VDWSPGRGSEQTDIRPALIVQNDLGNHSPNYPNTIVVAISTRGRDIPFHVLIRPSKANGFTEDSYAKCEQLLTLDKARLVDRPLGRLTDGEMARVTEALKRSLAIS